LRRRDTENRDDPNTPFEEALNGKPVDWMENG